jgi:hypothetical protein
MVGATDDELPAAAFPVPDTEEMSVVFAAGVVT